MLKLLVNLIFIFVFLIVFPARTLVWAQQVIPAEQLMKQLKVAPTRSFGQQSFGPREGRASMSAIQFEYNSSELTPTGRKQVDELARAIKGLGQDSFQVVGHTDASGSDEYNLWLSRQRAKTVHEYLVRQHGIDPSRLKTIGKGESQLTNSQNPNAAENRRVEAVNVKVLEGN